eukprot:tig00001284_g8010.t1
MSASVFDVAAFGRRAARAIRPTARPRPIRRHDAELPLPPPPTQDTITAPSTLRGARGVRWQSSGAALAEEHGCPHPKPADEKACHDCSRAAFARCWNCKSPVPERSFFCIGCNRVQEPRPCDHFAVFTCPRTFELDPKDLDKRYKNLQMRLHPDRFATQTEREREIAAMQSARVNEAYTILKRPHSRATYLLRLFGIDVGETGGTIADPQVLMEAMEGREAIEDAEDDAAALGALNERYTGLARECVRDLTRSFDAGELEAARRHAIRLQYLTTILDEIYDRLPAH